MNRDEKTIVLLLPAAITIAFMAYAAIINLYVDPYISAYSDLGRSPELFNFYQNAPDCPKIYYWGSSSIKEDLDLTGQKCQFNLGNPASTPLRRLAELDAAINSKPKTVVFTVEPMSFSNAWLFPHDQYALISSQTVITPYLRAYYNETILDLLTLDHLDLLLYKRKFIQPATSVRLDSIRHALIGTKSPYYYQKYNHDFTSESLSIQINESHAPDFEQKLEEKTGFKEYHVPSGKNIEKTVFEFIIHTLRQENISVTVVKVPLNPMLLQKIPPEYLQNYNTYLEKVAETYQVDVLDYTSSYNSSLFYDGHHLNKEGRQLFSQNITQVVS